MSKVLLIFLSALIAPTTFGQGQFFFSNRDLTAGVDAKMFLCNDRYPQSSLDGPDWVVNLLGGPSGGQLQPLEPSSTTFRSGAAAGYVVPITVTVPGVQPGAAADVRLVITHGEQSWEHYTYTITSLGGGTVTPPTLPMGYAASTVGGLCPEPSSLWLGSAGIAAVLLISRRRPASAARSAL